MAGDLQKLVSLADWTQGVVAVTCCWLNLEFLEFFMQRIDFVTVFYFSVSFRNDS